MSYNSLEREFYVKHYGSNQPSFDDPIDLHQVRADHFVKGKRYYLVERAANSVNPKGRLLELGCGHGATLRYMADTFHFEDNIGVDIVYAEEKPISDAKRIRIIPANFNEKLPFDDDSIDLLIAMMVIEHLFCPFHAFGEIVRLLSRHGIAIINLPLVTGIKNRIRLLFGQLPVTSVPYARWYRDRQWDGNHLHYFSVNSIKDLCTFFGLEIIAMSAVGRYVDVKNAFPRLLASELTFAVKRR